MAIFSLRRWIVRSENVRDAAPLAELQLVHSSFGRLRVHLPHWSGGGDDELAATVRRLTGVTHAEASPLTGNLLVLFTPGETTAEVLLQALPRLHVEAPQLSLFPGDDAPPRALAAVAAPDVVPVEVLPRQQIGPDGYVTGTTRIIYQALGWASVGMAVVGAIVPGIPTAPFVILAGYFFIRSSREAHQWLRQSRWFGPMLRDWEDHRAVRRSIRNFAVGLILFSMAFTALLGLPTAVTASIITLQIVGLAIVLSLRVVDGLDTPQPLLAATP